MCYILRYYKNAAIIFLQIQIFFFFFRPTFFLKVLPYQEIFQS